MKLKGFEQLVTEDPMIINALISGSEVEIHKLSKQQQEEILQFASVANWNHPVIGMFVCLNWWGIPLVRNAPIVKVNNDGDVELYQSPSLKFLRTVEEATSARRFVRPEWTKQFYYSIERWDE